MTKALPKQDVLVEVVDSEAAIFVWLDNPDAYIGPVGEIHGAHYVTSLGKSLIIVGTDSRFDIEEVAQEIRDLLEPLA